MGYNLISKKELLKVTGISYGQLYRWKRKDIIPEEWFIKKSTTTGQETFFPKEEILKRINDIKDMKEDLSLDELAHIFSNNPSNISLEKNELIKKEIISEETIKIFEEIHGILENFDFVNILNPYILDSLLKSGKITYEEAKSLLKILGKNSEEFLEKNYELVLIRKYGVSIWIVGEIIGDIILDEYSKIILKIPILKFIQELKFKL